MKRSITAALVAAVAMFSLVTAQTGTQTQQTSQQTQQTNTTTPAVNNSTTATDTTATTDPVTIDPVDEADATATTTTPRTGEKESKAVVTSCPIHPEVKTRTAGKCPVCRMEERKQTAVLEKEGTPQPQPELTPAPQPSPLVQPTPLVSPTREPVTQEPMTQDTDSTQPTP